MANKWNATAAYQQLLRLETMWETYPTREREAAAAEQILYTEDASGKDTEQVLAYINDAAPEDVMFVLDTAVGDGDGRTQWKWIRLQNGDLILGCFPSGETYEAVSDRQNEAAARLWKAHAEAGIQLTDGERTMIRNALIEFGAQTPEAAAEVLRILHKLG